MIQMNLFTKYEQTHQHRKQTYTKGKRQGKGLYKPGVEISRHKLLYIKEINNKVLPYSKGNYIQYLVINDNGKESEKKKRAYI